MRYLSGTPFSVAVGNGKLTQEQWDAIFDTKRVENATKPPACEKRTEPVKVTRKK